MIRDAHSEYMIPTNAKQVRRSKWVRGSAFRRNQQVHFPFSILHFRFAIFHLMLAID